MKYIAEEMQSFKKLISLRKTEQIWTQRKKSH